jgi:hypothetical protein
MFLQQVGLCSVLGLGEVLRPSLLGLDSYCSVRLGNPKHLLLVVEFERLELLKFRQCRLRKLTPLFVMDYNRLSVQIIVA